MNPVFVTSAGPGRCGTTRMQLALSTLKGIHIAGQPSVLPLAILEQIAAEMIDRGAVAMESNAGKGYQHHIDGNSRECVASVRVFAEAAWFRGCRDSLIIGAKLNGVMVDDHIMRSLWPDAQCIMCVRHPWKTWISLINTYGPKLSWVDFADKWARAIAVAKRTPNTCIVKLEDSAYVVSHFVATALRITPDQREVLEKALGRRVHASPDKPQIELREEQYSVGSLFVEMADDLGYAIKNGVPDDVD